MKMEVSAESTQKGRQDQQTVGHVPCVHLQKRLEKAFSPREINAKAVSTASWNQR